MGATAVQPSELVQARRLPDANPSENMAGFPINALLSELRALSLDLTAVGTRLEAAAWKGLNTTSLVLQLESMRSQVAEITRLLEHVETRVIEDENILKDEAASLAKKRTITLGPTTTRPVRRFEAFES